MNYLKLDWNRLWNGCSALASHNGPFVRRRLTTSATRTAHAMSWCLCLAIVLSLLGSASAAGQSDATSDYEQTDELLYRRDPYDLITLDKQHENKVLKVLPLEFSDRRVPPEEERRGAIEVRLVEDPTVLYEVSWTDIASVQLFEELVLQQAETLTDKGQFDDAFRTLEFLLAHYPRVPRLNAVVLKLLYRELASAYRAHNFDNAFNLALELHRRRPGSSRVRQALDRVAEKIVARYVNDRDFDAARQILRTVLERLEEDENTQMGKWRDRLRQQAAEGRRRARQAAAAGDLSAAVRASRSALRLWPSLEGLAPLARQLDRQYPAISVGVFVPSRNDSAPRIDSPASLRTHRLLDRTLLELVGYDSQGGRYACPVGTYTPDDSGLQLTFSIRPQTFSASKPVLTAYDLSGALLGLVTIRDYQWQPLWFELLESVSVDDVFTLQVHLRRRYARAEALLSMPVRARPTGGDIRPARMGPFRVAERSPTAVRYVTNDQRVEGVDMRLKEITEHWYPDTEAAISALRQGDIDVLARVPPWRLQNISQGQEITVVPYALPTVHVLVPNTDRPLMASRTFRRALIYGIHRQSILDRVVLGGNARDGFVVLSGPFPAGVHLDDAIGYASDPVIEPRPYEPRMCAILATAAQRELSASAARGPGDAQVAATRQTADAQTTDRPPLSARTLVLLHPPDPTARICCDMIRSHLGLLGISVELREDDLEQAASDRGDYDLRYAEIACWEPVADVHKMLGLHGVVGETSPYMQHALRQLDRAGNWNEARQSLREIHRLAHDEVPVIPLWQTINYLAYRRRIAGLEGKPVLLYQNVENWRVAR